MLFLLLSGRSLIFKGWGWTGIQERYARSYQVRQCDLSERATTIAVPELEPLHRKCNIGAGMYMIIPDGVRGNMLNTVTSGELLQLLAPNNLCVQTQGTETKIKSNVHLDNASKTYLINTANKQLPGHVSELPFPPNTLKVTRHRICVWSKE